jgi:hypothetical protein
MKFSKLLVAAAFVVPAFAVAQSTPKQAKPDPKTTFSVLKANVAKITAPAEKERWQANKDAWEVEVAQTGKVRKVELGKMLGAIDRIKANVAKIRAGSEKERWQANIDLWDLFLSRAGAFEKTDLTTASAALETMKANVAAISAPVERERWQANRDLWQAALDRASTK